VQLLRLHRRHEHRSNHRGWSGNGKVGDSEIDREIGDLVTRGDDNAPAPIATGLGKQFIYARYNAELSTKWLDKRGLSDVDPASVAQLDSVDHIDDLVRVGQALAKEVKLEHFVLERFGQFY
jgi:hypothetical protein